MMKRFAYCVIALFISGGCLKAQYSQGGTPLQLPVGYTQGIGYVPQVTLPLPDMNTIMWEDSLAYTQDILSPVRIGTLVNTAIHFSDGIITTLDNGNKIWRLRIAVPGSPALGLYYNQFKLPAGVKYFIANGNGKQILGAYTAASNPDGDAWVTEKVQGDVINLQLDISKDADEDQIILDIDRVGIFYNAIGYLETYGAAAPANGRKTKPVFNYNGSSKCQVNAICPPGNNFDIPRKATVHIEYVSGNSAVAATGTLVNNTSGDCTPYILTATHIEKNNNTADNAFAQWMFYFNYETAECSYTTAQPASTHTMTGAYFRARSKFINSNFIVGDFLLVQLRQKVPASYDTWFAGWDRSGKLPDGQCISFHHPVGDAKKLVYSDAVPWADGEWGKADTHWEIDFEKGGNESGSSGAGLFDPAGRLIGDLTGGGYAPPLACSTMNSYGKYMSNYGKYSKLSLNWQYTYQSPSSAATRLKDWLDPLNTQAEVLDPIPATCFPAAVPSMSSESGIGLHIYPNPSSGNVYLEISGLRSNEKSLVRVVNIQGRVVSEQIVINSHNKIQLTMQDYPAGLYLVQVVSGSNIVTEKIVHTP